MFKNSKKQKEIEILRAYWRREKPEVVPDLNIGIDEGIPTTAEETTPLEKDLREFADKIKAKSTPDDAKAIEEMEKAFPKKERLSPVKSLMDVVKRARKVEVDDADGGAAKPKGKDGDSPTPEASENDKEKVKEGERKEKRESTKPAEKPKISDRLLKSVDKATGNGREKKTRKVEVEGVKKKDVFSAMQRNDKLIAYYKPAEDGEEGNVIFVKRGLKEDEIPEGYEIIKIKANDKRIEQADKEYNKWAIIRWAENASHAAGYWNREREWNGQEISGWRKAVVDVANIEKQALKLSVGWMPLINAAMRTRSVFGEYGEYEDAGLITNFIGSNYRWGSFVNQSTDGDITRLSEVDISSQRLKMLNAQRKEISKSKDKDALADIDKTIAEITDKRLAVGRQAKNFVRDVHGDEVWFNYLRSMYRSTTKDLLLDAAYNGVRAATLSMMSFYGTEAMMTQQVASNMGFTRFAYALSTPVYYGMQRLFNKNRFDKGAFKEALAYSLFGSMLSFFVPSVLEQHLSGVLADLGTSETVSMWTTPYARSSCAAGVSLGLSSFQTMKMKWAVDNAETAEERARIMAKYSEVMALRAGMGATMGFMMYNSPLKSTMLDLGQSAGILDSRQDLYISNYARRHNISIEEAQQQIQIDQIVRQSNGQVTRDEAEQYLRDQENRPGPLDPDRNYLPSDRDGSRLQLASYSPDRQDVLVVENDLDLSGWNIDPQLADSLRGNIIVIMADPTYKNLTPADLIRFGLSPEEANEGMTPELMMKLAIAKDLLENGNFYKDMFGDYGPDAYKSPQVLIGIAKDVDLIGDYGLDFSQYNAANGITAEDAQGLLHAEQLAATGGQVDGRRQFATAPVSSVDVGKIAQDIIEQLDAKVEVNLAPEPGQNLATVEFNVVDAVNNATGSSTQSDSFIEEGLDIVRAGLSRVSAAIDSLSGGNAGQQPQTPGNQPANLGTPILAHNYEATIGSGSSTVYDGVGDVLHNLQVAEGTDQVHVIYGHYLNDLNSPDYVAVLGELKSRGIASESEFWNKIASADAADRLAVMNYLDENPRVAQVIISRMMQEEYGDSARIVHNGAVVSLDTDGHIRLYAEANSVSDQLSTLQTRSEYVQAVTPQQGTNLINQQIDPASVNYYTEIGANGHSAMQPAVADLLRQVEARGGNVINTTEIYRHYLQVLNDDPELVANLKNTSFLPPTFWVYLGDEDYENAVRFLDENTGSMIISNVLIHQANGDLDVVNDGLIIKINPISNEIMFSARADTLAQQNPNTSFNPIVYTSASGEVVGVADPALGDIVIYEDYMVATREPRIFYSMNSYSAPTDTTLAMNEVAAINTGEKVLDTFVVISGQKYFYDESAQNSTDEFYIIQQNGTAQHVAAPANLLLVINDANPFIANKITQVADERGNPIVFYEDPNSDNVFVEGRSAPWGTTDVNGNFIISSQNQGQVIAISDGTIVGTREDFGTTGATYISSGTTVYEYLNGNLRPIDSNLYPALGISINNGDLNILYREAATPAINIVNPDGSASQLVVVRDPNNQGFLYDSFLNQHRQIQGIQLPDSFNSDLPDTLNGRTPQTFAEYNGVIRLDNNTIIDATGRAIGIVVNYQGQNHVVFRSPDTPANNYADAVYRYNADGTLTLEPNISITVSATGEASIWQVADPATSVVLPELYLRDPNSQVNQPQTQLTPPVNPVPIVPQQPQVNTPQPPTPDPTQQPVVPEPTAQPTQQSVTPPAAPQNTPEPTPQATNTPQAVAPEPTQPAPTQEPQASATPDPSQTPSPIPQTTTPPDNSFVPAHIINGLDAPLEEFANTTNGVIVYDEQSDTYKFTYTDDNNVPQELDLTISMPTTDINPITNEPVEIRVLSVEGNPLNLVIAHDGSQFTQIGYQSVLEDDLTPVYYYTAPNTIDNNAALPNLLVSTSKVSDTQSLMLYSKPDLNLLATDPTAAVYAIQYVDDNPNDDEFERYMVVPDRPGYFYNQSNPDNILALTNELKYENGIYVLNYSGNVWTFSENGNIHVLEHNLSPVLNQNNIFYSEDGTVVQNDQIIGHFDASTDLVIITEGDNKAVYQITAEENLPTAGFNKVGAAIVVNGETYYNDGDVVYVLDANNDSTPIAQEDLATLGLAIDNTGNLIVSAVASPTPTITNTPEVIQPTPNAPTSFTPLPYNPDKPDEFVTLSIKLEDKNTVVMNEDRSIYLIDSQGNSEFYGIYHGDPDGVIDSSGSILIERFENGTTTYQTARGVVMNELNLNGNIYYYQPTGSGTVFINPDGSIGAQNNIQVNTELNVILIIDAPGNVEMIDLTNNSPVTFEVIKEMGEFKVLNIGGNLRIADINNGFVFAKESPLTQDQIDRAVLFGVRQDLLLIDGQLYNPVPQPTYNIDGVSYIYRSSINGKYFLVNTNNTDRIELTINELISQYGIAYDENGNLSTDAALWIQAGDSGNQNDWIDSPQELRTLMNSLQIEDSDSLSDEQMLNIFNRIKADSTSRDDIIDLRELREFKNANGFAGQSLTEVLTALKNEQVPAASSPTPEPIQPAPTSPQATPPAPDSQVTQMEQDRIAWETAIGNDATTWMYQISELKTFLDVLGVDRSNLSDDQLAAVLSQMQPASESGDGSIDFNEFLNIKANLGLSDTATAKDVMEALIAQQVIEQGGAEVVPMGFTPQEYNPEEAVKFGPGVDGAQLEVMGDNSVYKIDAGGVATFYGVLFGQRAGAGAPSGATFIERTYEDGTVEYTDAAGRPQQYFVANNHSYIQYTDGTYIINDQDVPENVTNRVDWGNKFVLIPAANNQIGEVKIINWETGQEIQDIRVVGNMAAFNYGNGAYVITPDHIQTRFQNPINLDQVQQFGVHREYVLIDGKLITPRLAAGGELFRINDDTYVIRNGVNENYVVQANVPGEVNLTNEALVAQYGDLIVESNTDGSFDNLLWQVGDLGKDALITSPEGLGNLMTTLGIDIEGVDIQSIYDQIKTSGNDGLIDYNEMRRYASANGMEGQTITEVLQTLKDQQLGTTQVSGGQPAEAVSNETLTNLIANAEYSESNVDINVNLNGTDTQVEIMPSDHTVWITTADGNHEPIGVYYEMSTDGNAGIDDTGYVRLVENGILSDKAIYTAVRVERDIVAIEGRDYIVFSNDSLLEIKDDFTVEVNDNLIANPEYGYIKKDTPGVFYRFDGTETTYAVEATIGNNQYATIEGTMISLTDLKPIALPQQLIDNPESATLLNNGEYFVYNGKIYNDSSTMNVITLEDGVYAYRVSGGYYILTADDIKHQSPGEFAADHNLAEVGAYNSNVYTNDPDAVRWSIAAQDGYLADWRELKTLMQNLGVQPADGSGAPHLTDEQLQAMYAQMLADNANQFLTYEDFLKYAAAQNIPLPANMSMKDIMSFLFSTQKADAITTDRRTRFNGSTLVIEPSGYAYAEGSDRVQIGYIYASPISNFIVLYKDDKFYSMNGQLLEEIRIANTPNSLNESGTINTYFKDPSSGTIYTPLLINNHRILVPIDTSNNHTQMITAEEQFGLDQTPPPVIADIKLNYEGYRNELIAVADRLGLTFVREGSFLDNLRYITGTTVDEAVGVRTSDATTLFDENYRVRFIGGNEAALNNPVLLGQEEPAQAIVYDRFMQMYLQNPAYFANTFGILSVNDMMTSLTDPENGHFRAVGEVLQTYLMQEANGDITGISYAFTINGNNYAGNQPYLIILQFRNTIFANTGLSLSTDDEVVKFMLGLEVTNDKGEKVTYLDYNFNWASILGMGRDGGVDIKADGDE